MSDVLDDHREDPHYRWAAEWWKYPEGVARREGLWWAWVHLRQNPATGSTA